LPLSEFGAATTAFVFINRNDTLTIGFGCIVDARWAEGGSTAHDGVGLNVWEPYIGHLALPQNGRFTEAKYTTFLEPAVKKYLGQLIQADQIWLDAISPVPNGSSTISSS